MPIVIASLSTKMIWLEYGKHDDDFMTETLQQNLRTFVYNKKLLE